MSRNMPWYKREPAAFFQDTVGWRGEVKCAYSLLLDLVYMHGGKVADDSAYISAQLGHTKTMWTRTIRTSLLERGVIEISDGYLTNPRATREINDVKTQRKPQETRQNSAKTLPKKPIKTTTQNTQEKDIDITPNPLQGNEGFDEFFEAYPQARRQDPERALSAWRELTVAERAAAKLGLTGLRAEAARLDKLPVTPATYLRGKHWVKYSASKPANDLPCNNHPLWSIYVALKKSNLESVWSGWIAVADNVELVGKKIIIPNDYVRSGAIERAGDALASAGFLIAEAA